MRIIFDNTRAARHGQRRAGPGLAGRMADGYISSDTCAISQVRIPVLAIFGDQDRQGDPLQGAYAYRKALGEAGNPKSRVEVFPNANHGIFTSKTGCLDDDQKTMTRWSLWFAITHALTSQEKFMAYLSEDPYKPGLLASFPFAPGFLDLIENWLKGLYADEQ